MVNLDQLVASFALWFKAKFYCQFWEHPNAIKISYKATHKGFMGTSSQRTYLQIQLHWVLEFSAETGLMEASKLSLHLKLRGQVNISSCNQVSSLVTTRLQPGEVGVRTQFSALFRFLCVYERRDLCVMCICMCICMSTCVGVHMCVHVEAQG